MAFNPRSKIAKKLRVNQQIKVPTVRLIADDESQLGIMAIEKALALAEEKGLDLVEVAPKANPPVCKVIDYGKYLYHQKKIDQKHRKMQKKSEMKGIRLSMRTDQGDMDIKVKRAKKFLAEGNSLKVQLIFKGREMQHKDLGFEKMNQLKEMLADVAKVDQEPKSQGYQMIMILNPLK